MPEPLSSAAAFAPRALPISQAFAWFQSAMRLFKLSPWRWCALGCITLGIKLGLEFVPGIGRAAAEVVVPVVECGLFIGAAPLIVFGVISLALIAVGLLAYLAPLVAIFPLLAAANYAAWKDIYAPRPETLTTY